MKKLFPLVALVVGAFAFSSLHGQSPAPVILQAVTPMPAGAVAPAPAVAAVAPNSKSTVQYLQEMQLTNAATIKKQEAALASLDALQTAADEIKIYSKRG